MRSLARSMKHSLASLVSMQPSRPTVTILNRGVTRMLCLLLAITLMFNSTPVAAQTIAGVSSELGVSFVFWLQTSGSLTTLKRLLAGQYLLKTNRQETQSERDAKVSRVRISPADVTAHIGEVVRFSAIGYTENGDTIGGVQFRWRARGKESAALISAATNAEVAKSFFDGTTSARLSAAAIAVPPTKPSCTIVVSQPVC